MEKFEVSVFFNVEFENGDFYENTFEFEVEESPAELDNSEMLELCENKLIFGLEELCYEHFPEMSEIDIMEFKAQPTFGKWVFTAEAIFYPKDEDEEPEIPCFYIELAHLDTKQKEPMIRELFHNFIGSAS